ncbi:hypothetical protein [Novosphingobium resinovorum]|uniref:hypothetical protein n=1 Tax=Novosphingobium resinovorum TaxID=158500 RepID=UPI002ED5E38A|nr:hypothetical protein [Novosphingobium resinovorum]
MRIHRSAMAAALIAAALGCASASSLASPPAAGAPAPARFVDPLTGHEVVRISREPGSVSLYFHQNSFTSQGDAMAVSTPSGIAEVRLADWSSRLIVRDPQARLLFVGRRTRTVYFSKAGPGQGSRIFAADFDTSRVRQVAQLARGEIGSINAGEILLLGVEAERSAPLQPGGEGSRPGEIAFGATGPDGKPLPYAEAKEVRLDRRLETRVPMRIFTLDLRTGAQRTVIASDDWLNHIQFSPTDPHLLMCCQEGPWHPGGREDRRSAQARLPA